MVLAGIKPWSYTLRDKRPNRYTPQRQLVESAVTPLSMLRALRSLGSVPKLSDQ